MATGGVRGPKQLHN